MLVNSVGVGRRAVAERCPQPAMRNLITFGAQHEGVFGLPNCDPDNFFCEEMRRLLNLGAYIEYFVIISLQSGGDGRGMCSYSLSRCAEKNLLAYVNIMGEQSFCMCLLSHKRKGFVSYLSGCILFSDLLSSLVVQVDMSHKH